MKFKSIEEVKEYFSQLQHECYEKNKNFLPDVAGCPACRKERDEKGCYEFHPDGMCGEHYFIYSHNVKNDMDMRRAEREAVYRITHKEYFRIYRKSHKGYFKKYRRDHKDHLKELNSKWQKAHPGYYKERRKGKAAALPAPTQAAV